MDDKIKASSLGVKMGNESLHTPLYADDLLLLAENPKDMQLQLDLLDNFVTSIKNEN
ncbi:MAG: hypothetical protein GY891_04825 [Bacteroidetes bacterium]|nr:hypothetical protein [Bacteroidota bacterium]